MPISMPSYIASSAVTDAPIKYKWSEDIAMDLDDTENDRLYTAIDASSFKAKYAVGLVLTEWVVWRLQGRTDIADALQRIEAAWTGVVHPAYLGDLSVGTEVNHDKDKVGGPLESAMENLFDMGTDYARGNIYLAEAVMKQAVVARHVMPDRKMFEAWLNETLKKLAKAFPRGVDYDEDTEEYDASDEPPVPREFFEPTFAYSPASAKQCWMRHLQEAESSGNPYLRPTKQLAKAGLSGKPYRLD